MQQSVFPGQNSPIQTFWSPIPDTARPLATASAAFFEAFGKPTRGAARNSVNLRERNIAPRPFEGRGSRTDQTNDAMGM